MLINYKKVYVVSHFNLQTIKKAGIMTQGVVAVFGILRFPPAKMAEIKPHLKILVDTTYKNDGCIAYDVAEDFFDLGLIRFSELWPNAESLANHLKAPHIEPWRAAALACGLLERNFTAYSTNASWAV